MMRFKILIICCLLLLHPIYSSAQGLPAIKQWIEAEDYHQAMTGLDMLIELFSSGDQMDSLIVLPYYKGIILMELEGAESANSRVEEFIERITTLGASYRQQFVALEYYTRFLDETGQAHKSFEVARRMLGLTELIPDISAEETGKILYDMGVGAWRMGDMTQARGYFSRALQTYESFQLAPSQNLADAYNAMGAMMWLSSEMDSASYFYSRSVEVVGKMDADTIDKAFLSAVTLANIGLLHQVRGHTSRAIETLEQTINLHNFVIEKGSDPVQKRRSEQFRLRATLNLAAFYNSIGHYHLAHEMARFVYNSYKDLLSEGDPEIYKALIRVGESRMSLRDYQNARLDFEKAIELMSTSHGGSTYWKAIALSRLAETYAELGNTPEAITFFRESRQLFDQTMGRQYDIYYVSTLGKEAVFYASVQMPQEALNAATISLQLARDAMGAESPAAITRTIEKARVYFLLGDYENSSRYSLSAIEIIERKKKETQGIAEVFQMERYLPGAIILHTRSVYQLSGQVTDELLARILARLQDAREVLNQRKMYFASGENVLALMDENRELFDWKKYVYLKRYQKTGNPQWIHYIADIHEFEVFQKIRLGFLLRNATSFYGVPQQVLEQEFEIMQKFAGVMSLPGESENEDSFDRIIESWENHLHYLELNYPDYFSMRFGDLSGKLKMVMEQLDANTTVVRYVFIGDELFAMVIGKNDLQFIELKESGLEEKINRLNTFLPEAVELGLLRDLYAGLWQPLEHAIHTRNVIILPDRYLFNLAFETLVPEFVESYRDLASYSLLKRHVISYNFSLAVMNTHTSGDFERSYVAFVPGFAEEMKRGYATVAELNQDQEYLQLLPQPFTLELAHNIRRRLGGQTFTKDNSTLDNFIRYAGNQRILHIGTHAQVNNVSPGFSRLIFAKDLHNQEMNPGNHLYANTIYQLNLRSQLTVLTACETGKPFYRPGEGMISLAHAFHYAGSESMLTSLWQIDEYASAIIVSAFYNHLAAGMSRAEALREAKLGYLATARGRTLAPVYWAGVILMGDPGPMVIQPPFFSRYRGVIAILFLVLLAGFWWLRKKISKKSA